MTTLSLVLLPLWLFAAPRPGDSPVIVADSRKFTGWQAWWANLYNDSHFWFAAITIVVIPVTALIFGRLTSIVMVRLGINLKSRELSEH
jgi:hypothetical protein